MLLILKNRVKYLQFYTVTRAHWPYSLKDPGISYVLLPKTCFSVSGAL
jgi:hypothetical protein